jgi:hypothetical protein
MFKHGMEDGTYFPTNPDVSGKLTETSSKDVVSQKSSKTGHVIFVDTYLSYLIQMIQKKKGHPFPAARWIASPAWNPKEFGESWKARWWELAASASLTRWPSIYPARRKNRWGGTKRSQDFWAVELDNLTLSCEQSSKPLLVDDYIGNYTTQYIGGFEHRSCVFN